MRCCIIHEESNGRLIRCIVLISAVELRQWTKKQEIVCWFSNEHFEWVSGYASAFLAPILHYILIKRKIPYRVFHFLMSCRISSSFTVCQDFLKLYILILFENVCVCCARRSASSEWKYYVKDSFGKVETENENNSVAQVFQLFCEKWLCTGLGVCFEPGG